MNRQAMSHTTVSMVILMVLFFLCPAPAFAVDTPFSIAPGKTDSAESVHAILSKMSNEQVRLMLIAELKKDTATESSTFSLETETEGPAAPMARMLKILDNKSQQSEHQLDKLWEGIPDLLPDLYRVFVSL